MAYGECKIYNDGSHYIAIPHTTRPSRKRPKAPEEEIEVIESTKAQEESSPSNTEGEPFELLSCLLLQFLPLALLDVFLTVAWYAVSQYSGSRRYRFYTRHTPFTTPPCDAGFWI